MFLEFMAAVSAGSAIYNAVSSYNAMEDAKQQALFYGNLEADEILRREAYNEETLKLNEQDFESQAIAAGGMRNIVGAGLGDVIRSRNNLQRNLAMYREEAEFKARMARAGATQQAELYSDKATASLLGGLTGVAQAGASYYNLSQKHAPVNQAKSDSTGYQPSTITTSAGNVLGE